MENLSPITPNGATSKFPAFDHDFPPRRSDDFLRSANWGMGMGAHRDSHSPVLGPGARSQSNGRYNGLLNGSAARGGPGHASRHSRQKSLTEAIRNIRTRSGSVTQNTIEIAEALAPPVSATLLILFSIWYFASVMSSTSSKQILDTFPKPITLTVLQFAYVAGWCLLISWISHIFPSLKKIPALKNGIIRPNMETVRTTLKLTAFMIGGHILSSDAISRIDVSLVHTIKGLSPLLTVAAYRFIYKHQYSPATYLSLIPLTLGVFLACSTNFSANFLGICSAFASALTFVTQNIVSKRIFTAAAKAEAEPGTTKKPDKLNLLCYSSLFALLFTLPLWLWSEGWPIITGFVSENGALSLSTKNGALNNHWALFLEYTFNGTFHFLQSLTAFVLLSMVSPVTYSVASLVKRVFVIVFSIIWFGNKISTVQGVGIGLTFFGLYLYDRFSESRKQPRGGRSAAAAVVPLLPVAEKDSPPPHVTEFPAHNHLGGPGPTLTTNGSVHVVKDHVPGSVMAGKTNIGAGAGWLPSGTRAEDTWRFKDLSVST